MSQGNEQPGFWALIPASVRYDKELPPNAKLLYGEVTALSDKLGYCYAQNSYFSDLFGLSERSVTRLLSTLVDRGYLRVDVVRPRRRSWSGGFMPSTTLRGRGHPLPTKMSGPLLTKLSPPLLTKMSERSIQDLIIYPL